MMKSTFKTVFKGFGMALTTGFYLGAVSIFPRRNGASGSWAEPYFACPALRYGGFTYTPGIR